MSFTNNSKSYIKTIEIVWANADPNGHVRHSSYYDFGAHSRIKFFADLGFDTSVRAKLGIGPILFKEQCAFIRELKVDDTITINLQLGRQSVDGGKWTLHHEIYNSKNEKCAHISVEGAWMDLNRRKLTLPPKKMIDALNLLERGSDYIYEKKNK